MHNSIVTAGHAVSPPVVVLVADPVAAIVTRGVAEPGRVVGVLSCGEVLGVETEIVSTPGPSRVSTVCICITVALSLSAGMIRSASPLTAVVFCVPSSSSVRTIVCATDHGSLAKENLKGGFSSLNLKF